jgi:hypothetical protein
MLEQNGFPFTNYGCAGGYDPGPSEPGEPSSDSKKIVYSFPGLSPCLLTLFNVTMEMVEVSGVKKCRWSVYAEFWDGSNDTQTVDQAFPQRVVFSPYIPFLIPTTPPIVMGVLARFYPATYAEGGSPWPRVPPGPP